MVIFIVENSLLELGFVLGAAASAVSTHVHTDTAAASDSKRLGS